ncbi:RNA polymerase [Reinekea sp. G2M2-21]|uniref:RNA polymerase n=1 Tax=Reinekea sp. G2M2-21 TaxID=2788942 RepID=UPI0018A9E6E7|nr:RNA polymerase [Reinekea sp. G2M2-21]
MNIYHENGFQNRKAYLESLADNFELDLDTVMLAASMLGPEEDFDGLVTTLEDHAGCL